MEYRITLANVDRNVDLAHTLIAARHPSETMEHVTLRVLAWCLLYDERLEFGAGLSDPDAADLWAHDLTGRLVTWIECGGASGDKLRKVVQHHAGAAVHCVFSSARRREELLAEIADWKRAGEIKRWTVDPAMVATLAERDQRRQQWTVTVVGDHFYVEADSLTVEGAVERG